MSKQVEIKCKGASALPIESLVPFQGELKTLSEENFKKLKRDILELGFSEPISIWNGQDKAYILNGHQRLHTLKKMQSEGYTIPEIPVNLVEADSLEQAKKKVLSLTSQFGVMSAQGLFDFIKDTTIKFDDINASFNFPDMNMVSFKEKFFPVDLGKTREEKEDEAPDPEKIEVTVKPGDIYGLGEYFECDECHHIEEEEGTVKEKPDA